jgi:hypothetical protein
MSSDFGAKKSRRSNPVAMIVPALIVVLIAGAGGAMWVMQKQSKIAEAKAWHMSGPPCEAASQAAYAQLAVSQPRVVEIDSAQIARSSGDASCGEAPNTSGRGPNTIPVCRFSDPTTLDVGIGASHFYFLPRSEPATVSIVDGRPNCVLGAASARP